jgi:hypothetical protein
MGSAQDYGRAGCNPHVLTGALVGGPRFNDSYEDIRKDYVHNEVAINYNVGLTGGRATLLHATHLPLCRVLGHSVGRMVAGLLVGLSCGIVGAAAVSACHF